MAHQKRRPRKKEQGGQAVELEKKQHKRESRLEERLEKARERVAKALGGFKRAEERLQKCNVRVERVEGRLAIKRGQQAELATIAQPIPVGEAGGLSSVEDTVAPDEAAKLAREARAAAEAAEEAARAAAERAVEVSSRLEQPGWGRQLAEELRERQFEVEQANDKAREPNRVAHEAEILVGETDEVNETNEIDKVNGVSEADQPARETGSESIKEIEEEREDEKVVAAVAAMMIADVAAAAAAEAEAMAEASSARTREARFAALQADQVLEDVRTAIASGALSGDDARRCLDGAEREATRAHALLADAEATEEQALNAAMNAEAEAEVAEGMAFAASDTVELQMDDGQGLREPADMTVLVESTESTKSAKQAEPAETMGYATQPFDKNSNVLAHDTLAVRQEKQGEHEKWGERGAQEEQNEQKKQGADVDGEDDTEELPVIHEQGQA